MRHLSQITNLHEHPFEFYQKLGFVITGVVPDANGANLAIGALIGAGIGIIILLVLFATGLDPFVDTELFLTGWASIPITGIIGVLLAIFNRQPRPMPPSTPLDRSRGRIFGGLVK
jgi:hypothetical protein